MMTGMYVEQLEKRPARLKIVFMMVKVRNKDGDDAI